MRWRHPCQGRINGAELTPLELRKWPNCSGNRKLPTMFAAMLACLGFFSALAAGQESARSLGHASSDLPNGASSGRCAACAACAASIHSPQQVDPTEGGEIACEPQDPGPAMDIDPAVLQDILDIRREMGSVVAGLARVDDDEQFRDVLQDVIRDSTRGHAVRPHSGFESPRTDTVGPAFAPDSVSGWGSGLHSPLPAVPSPVAPRRAGHENAPQRLQGAFPAFGASVVSSVAPIGPVSQLSPTDGSRSTRLRTVAVNLEHLAAELEALGKFEDADQVRKIAEGVRDESRPSPAAMKKWSR